MSVHLAKTQISLGIRPVWSETSLCAQWVAKDPNFFHADSEDSDQTGSLHWVHSHFVSFVMSWLKSSLLIGLTLSKIIFNTLREVNSLGKSKEKKFLKSSKQMSTSQQLF